MGRVLLVESGAVRHLDCSTRIGRETDGGITLADAEVSRDHARISWINGAWHLRDLGSVHGTFLDGVRIAVGAEIPLAVRQVIQVGERRTMEVVSVEEPRPYVRNVATALEIEEAEEGGIDIPGVGVLARDLEIGTGWALTTAGARDPWCGALPGWTLRVPRPVPETARPGRTLRNAGVRFIVPRNLSRPFGLVLTLAGEEIDMKRCQPFFALWLLAKARGEFADGWISREALGKRAGYSPKHLDTYLCRVRERFVNAGIPDGRAIVEAPDGWRRIGLPPERISFVPEP